MIPGLQRAETLPARWYTDPAVYERERQAFFAREWLLLCHEAEVAEPGQVWAECIAGWPLLAVRGRDGVLRGFHNVCLHRASPILWDGAGRCEQLRCRYHGWVYDLEGRLRRVPEFGDAEDFEPGALSLHPVRIEAWRGFVFVNLGDEAPPLAEAIGPFAEAAARVPFESFQLHSRESHELACNWKTYVDNYLEGYHVPYLHPRMARELVTKEYRVEVGEHFVLHHVPTRPRVSGPVYEGFWGWFSPTAGFNVYAGGMSLERMLPVGPDRMRIDYTFLFREGTPAAEREEAFAMCRQVTGEDRMVCEAVQRNLAAGVYDRGRLSPRHEEGVFAFQQSLRAALHRG